MIVLQGLRRPVTALAFGHDGRELIAGGGFKPFEIWDSVAGKVIGSRRHLDASAPDPLGVNPHSGWKYLVVEYGQLAAIAPNGDWFGRDEIHPDHRGNWAQAFAVRPDGDRFVVGFSHPCELAAFAQTDHEKPTHLWTRATDPRDAHGTLRVRGLSYFPDGSEFAVLEVAYAFGGSASRFTVRSSATGEVRTTVVVPAANPDQIRVAPDGATIVVKCGQVLNVWDTADLLRPPTRVVNTNRKHFTWVAYHPSGKYLAATSRDETVKLYDTRTWAVAKTFTWKVGRLRSVAFSPDGARAAVGSDTGKVVIWDVDV